MEMKHIKTYQIFESKSFIDIDDINDILLDLKDEGFKIDVKKDHNASYDPSVGDYVELPERRVFENVMIKISIDTNFNTREVEEYAERIIEYIKTKGVDITVEYAISSNLPSYYHHGGGTYRHLAAREPVKVNDFPKNKVVGQLVIDIWIKNKWYNGNRGLVKKIFNKWKQR
jgi:hypothetical protein